MKYYLLEKNDILFKSNSFFSCLEQASSYDECSIYDNEVKTTVWKSNMSEVERKVCKELGLFSCVIEDKSDDPFFKDIAFFLEGYDQIILCTCFITENYKTHAGHNNWVYAKNVNELIKKIKNNV